MKKILPFLFSLFPLLSVAQSGPINIYYKFGGQVKSTKYAYLYNNTSFSVPFVRIDDKRGDKIPIEAVHHIEGKDEHGQYRYFKPIRLQGRDIWGERTFTSERISVYSTQITSGTWAASYSYKHMQYIKDNGQLQTVNYANLKRDLSDNSNSMRSVKKGNTIRATQFLLYGLGAALVVSGIASGLSDTSPSDPSNSKMTIPPAFIAGAVSLYIPWFLNTPKQKQFVRALKQYK